MKIEMGTGDFRLLITRANLNIALPGIEMTCERRYLRKPLYRTLVEHRFRASVMDGPDDRTSTGENHEHPDC